MMPRAITELHADFLEELEIGLGRSPKTIENYDRYLRRFYDQQSIAQVSDITQEAVRAFRRWLAETAPSEPTSRLMSKEDELAAMGVSLATQNYYLIAIRQFLKYLTQRDISVLSADKVKLAKLSERDIDVLYPEEVDALLSAVADDGVTGQRDKALLEILYSTGMRVSEVVRLNRDAIRANSTELPVRGKGNKVRVVFLSDAARVAVQQYLRSRHDTDPALFVRHGPNVADSSDLRLTARSVQRMIKKHAAAAGLTKDITPHTLRHSFATDLLANGADVRFVQQLLGHASITTTQVYTHMTDTQLKDIHRQFHRRKSSAS